MKKIVLTLVILLIICFTVGCSPRTESIEMNYGEILTLENEPLLNEEEYVWDNSNPTVVAVREKEITAVAPGTAILTAKTEEKILAVYEVKVSLVPVTGIVLATNVCNMVEEETFSLSYTLFPENASDYGLVWRTADDQVATVSEDGIITAKAPGQTTISISNPEGVIATCSVTVTQKAAYDRLTKQEKEFVDVFLSQIDQYKNPDSVIVKGIEKLEKMWIVETSAQNGFGGNSTSVYYLSSSGLWNWEMLDIDMEVDISPDSSYNIALINEAIAEKRGQN